jgi:hypothetical protein
MLLPVEVFYYEGSSIKYSQFDHTRITYDNDKKQLKLEQQCEANLNAERKGKYSLDLPSCDEFMEWRWRDMDSKGELEDGLIEAMKLCD